MERARCPFLVMLKSNRAFTLIEVLIAISISLVVIASAYTVFFAVKKGTFRVYESMKDRERVYNLFSILRKEIEGIYFNKKIEHSGIKIEENDFFGKPASKITFTSYFKEGVKVVSYFIEEKEGKLNLYKRIYDPLKEERAVKIIILRDIDGFKAVTLDGGDEKKVYDSQSSQKIPEYIKISLFFKKEDKENEELSQICKLMMAK